MNILLSSVAILISGVTMFLSGIFATPPEKVNLEPYAKKSDIASVQNDIFNLEDTVAKEFQKLGATNAIPTVVALFETSLASAISSSATSLTLTSATDKAGTTLASSTYAFIIDENSSSEEMVLADCTGTACTNVTRGINPLTGTTTTASLQKSHRRGASVKITDGPQLMILSRIINGIGTFPNILSYTSHPTFTSGTQIVDKTYVDSGVLAGAATSSESVTGIVRLATQIQMASSTPTTANTPYVLQAQYATSSPGYAGLWSVVTNNAGKIAQGFLDLTQTFSWSGLHTFSAGFISTASSTVNANLNVATTTSSTNIIGKGFGGTGEDGALTLTTGTTTINLAGATVVEKNYSSISITGDAAIEFSNPAAGGSIVIFKSQGNVTHTSSKQIYLVGVGSASGIGGTGTPGGSGAGGGGGASATADGAAGDNGDNIGATGAPTVGTAFGRWLFNALSAQVSLSGGGISSGGTCNGTAAPAGAGPVIATTNSIPAYLRAYVMPGTGGGGGCPGTGGNGADGGRGGGALYVEVGGALNITGAINATGGTSATVSAATKGCGGGGGGGSIQIIYNYLTANSGTYSVAGGSSGGTCTNPGGAGGAGYSSVTQNTSF